MESVVATVSGYHGSERFKLIKLISQTGANYVGALTKATTHLVCWKFEGRKYVLAKNFGAFIVNHQWFEDCLKQGKRLPEQPYILQSGQQVGPLLWEVPVVGIKENLLTRRKGDVSELKTDTQGRDERDTVGVDLLLLTETPILNLGTKRRNRDQKISKLNHRSTGKYCSLEPHLFVLDGPEHSELSCLSSMSPASKKRSVCDAFRGASTAESTRKSRRLVKKNAYRNFLESAVLDSGQECSHPVVCQLVDNTAGSDNSNDLRNENALTSETIMPEDGFCNFEENRNEGVVDTEGVRDFSNTPASNDSNLLSEDALLFMEKTSQDGLYFLEDNMSGDKKDLGSGQLNKLPNSIELSCVICFTDFSSTRGILPCGHRFCYSCIQNWADRMVSRGKVSSCPLCKTIFNSITKVDDADSSDQKIYSQTIPYASKAMDVFMLPIQETTHAGAQSSTGNVCCVCRCREPEDLLISCHLCHFRCVHSYCLDPPLVPWTCIHCKDLQMLYHNFR